MGLPPKLKVLRVTTILCSLLLIVSSDQNLDRQFTEMKTMISQIDFKMSAIDSKLSNMNVLEYAFKMNTIDNTLKTLNTRVDQMATQIESIKDSIKTLPTSCVQQQPEVRQERLLQNTNNTIHGQLDTANIVEKLDDYGKKILQSQKDLQTSVADHQQTLSGSLEVVRSGFSKTITKIESFLTVEGQVAAAISLIRQLIVTSDFIRDEISNLFNDVTAVKKVVTLLSDTCASLVQTAAEVKDSISFPVSQLDQAIEMGQEVQLEMTRLAELEKKVVKASSLSKELTALQELQPPLMPDINMSNNSNPDVRRHLASTNLGTLLEEIENMILPLFMSLPYNFQKIQTLIGDAFISMAHKSQCKLDHTITTEIRNFKELFTKHGLCRDQSEVFRSIFGDYSSSIQQMVRENLPDVSTKLTEIQYNVTRCAQFCNEHRYSTMRRRTRPSGVNSRRPSDDYRQELNRSHINRRDEHSIVQETL